MTADWELIVVAASVVACGLVAGVFTTFSDFVMKSLAASAPASGIEAMQIINRKVYKTVFMVLLLGMSVLSPLLIGYAYFTFSGAASAWIIAGASLYLAGVFLVTVVFNVPMNKRLDLLGHAGPDAASYWKIYVPVWSFWNTVRALSSGGSAICFLVACVWLTKSTIAP